MLIRAFIIWLAMAGAEVLHGILRNALLVPVVGDWRARQIGAIAGALLVLVIAYASVGWLGATSRRALLAIGVLWLALMLGFEILAGRYLAGYSWARIASDYDITRGGLLGIGMLALMLSPLAASQLRRAPVPLPPPGSSAPVADDPA